MPTMPVRVALVDMISEQLAEVGIKAVPEYVDWEELVGQHLRLRRFDAVLERLAEPSGRSRSRILTGIPAR